ncbi:MAG: hypothetical protein AAF598_15820 [Bacteroidota bacterium]
MYIRRIFCWSCIVLLPLTGWAQSQRSFKKLVQQTNTYLAAYARLSPFGWEELTALQDTNLPKKLQKAIQADPESYESLSADSISNFDLILEYQDLILQKLDQLTSHSKFTRNDLFELIEDDTDLWMFRSPDRKLYNFSLDEKTGGTYRSRLSIMHYTDWEVERLAVHPQELPNDAFDPYWIFEGDGFDRIDTLRTPTGVQYVLSGSVRGCTACFETNVLLVRFDQEGVHAEFSYSVTLRSYEDGVFYDPETRTIAVDYETDDLTTDCLCSNELDIEPSSSSYFNDADDEFEPIHCHCVFQFIDGQFKLIDSSPISEDD